MNPTFPSRLLSLLFLFLLGCPAFAATWYVSGDARTGDGSRSAPFPSLAVAEQASAAGDTIVLMRVAAAYERGIALKQGQTLAASEEGSPTIRVREGAAVSVRDAGDVSIRGITIELAEAAEGIVLTNTKGTVAIQGGALSGRGTGAAVLIDGGDAAITFDAFPIAQTSGAAAVIRHHRGPSVLFRKGTSIDAGASATDAITLTDNTGAYAFADPLHLVTRDAAALAIRDSGTVSIADASSTISATGATAIRIVHTAVTMHIATLNVDAQGAAVTDGVTLEQVSGTFSIGGGSMRDLTRRGFAIEKSKGIVIRNMQFTNVPSGNGATAQICGSPVATGEHLQCGATIHLHESEDIALQDLRIDESAQIAIHGDTVRNLSLIKVDIRGAGNELNEHGLQLRNIAGDLKLDSCHIEGSTSRQMHLLLDASEANVDIRNSTFGGSKPPEGGQGVLLTVGGEARVRIVIDGTTFHDNFSNAVQVAAAGKADVDLTLRGNTFRNSAAAVSLSASAASTLAYRLERNTISGSTSTAINAHLTTSGATRGTIERNIIGTSGKNDSGAVCGGACSGISVTTTGRGASTAEIAKNTIQQVDAEGIQLRAGGDASLAVRLAGNTIREPAGKDAAYALSLMAGMRRADRGSICAEIGGAGELANTIAGPWNAAGGGAAIAITKMNDRGTLSIAGYAGVPANAEGVSKFVAGRNRGGAVEATLGSGLTIADHCLAP